MAVPRCCCMRLESENNSYGFSLVATKNETGQYIEEVKEKSLAERCGLKNGDLVVEVNGQNIMQMSHPEVVELIREKGNEVSLLVLDSVARQHYDDLSVVVNSTMPEVKYINSWETSSLPETNGSTQIELTEKVDEDKPEAVVEEPVHETIPEVKVTSEPLDDLTPEITDLVEEEKHNGNPEISPDKSEKIEEKLPEVIESPVVPVQPPAATEAMMPKLVKPSNVPRTTPSRRACMGALKTFGDKAKVFDEL